MSMHEVGRVIPSDAWLTSLTGTVAPGVSLEGASGQTGALRSALGVPAIEIVGCTDVAVQGRPDDEPDAPDRRRHARRPERVREERGRVGGGGSDCRGTSDKFPQFSIVIYFAQAPTAPAPGTSSSTTPVAQKGSK